jgi:hypothetical protein
MEVDVMLNDHKSSPVPIPINNHLDKTDVNNENDVNFDVNKTYNRDVGSHHKLEDIDLEMNDGEIMDGPETMRKRGGESNRKKIQSIDNNGQLKQR